MRAQAAIELASSLLLLEIIVWIPGESPLAIWRLLPAALLAGVVLRSWRRRKADANGAPSIPSAPWRRAWGTVALATASATGLVFVFAWLGDYWQPSSLGATDLRRSLGALMPWLSGKVIAVTAQQLGLQFVALPLCLELLGRRSLAIAASAMIFSLIHLPNPLLVALTGMASIGWCTLHLRTGRIAPLIVSHLLLAVVARGAFDDAIYNMRIGAAVLPLLPSTIMADDGSKLRVTPLALDGFVDECSSRGEWMICVGWSADVERREFAQSIRVMGGGSVHDYPIAPPIGPYPRPDVATHFNLPKLEAVGYRLKLPAAWFAGGREVRFFGAGQDGEVSELEYADDLPGRP